MRTEKHVISIAGFDPSAGAGILSDIKTFEAHKVRGLGVCSCITYQNEVEISGISWISADEIIDQLKPLFKQYSIDFVKIGLIQNLESLELVIGYLREENQEIQIIWDPIIQSSSGFNFHAEFGNQHLPELCRKLLLVTPNYREIKSLISGISEEVACELLSEFCAVLLKGGHSGKHNCTDQLFIKGKVTSIETQRLKIEKHGTGCVLSAAITANLANELDLDLACELAKGYVFNFLQSEPGLMGQHSYKNAKIYS